MNTQRTKNFETHVQRFADYVNLEGASALEIGADRWQFVCNELIERGVSKIESTNLVDGWPELRELSEQITLRKVDANQLTSYYDEDTFNVVFGMAILEHIPNFNLMLEGINKVLKPGGVAYLHGGPIWTSPHGHHLFTKVKDVEYKFTDRPLLIDKWSHLYLSKQEMVAKVKETCPEEHAVAIADFIWDSPEQNRWSFTKIEEVVKNSPLKVVGLFYNAFDAPSAEILDKVIANGGDPDERYDVTGVTYFLKKVV